MTTTANPPATGPAYGIGPATGGLRAVAVGDRPGNLAHYASRALVLLSLINMLNYLDRYVVAAVLSSLRTSSLMVDDSQAGLLASSFIIVYTLSLQSSARSATGCRVRASSRSESSPGACSRWPAASPSRF